MARASISNSFLFATAALSLSTLFVLSPRLHEKLRHREEILNHDHTLIREASLNPNISFHSDLLSNSSGRENANALQFASDALQNTFSQKDETTNHSPATPSPAAHMPLCESCTPGERHLSCDLGLTVKAEGLYWTAREHHLISGITLAGLKPTDQIPPALDRWNFQGQVIRVEPDWDFGWRFALGYTSSCDFWDFFFDWTSFHTSKSRTLELLELPGWNPWGHPDTINGVHLFDLSSNWNLNYDVFTFELGRAFWIGRCLTFRPHFGITGSFIDQALNHAFEYEPKEFLPFGSTLNLDCDFSGMGLRSGFTLHFTNGTGFGFFGKFSYQLLYGKFDTSLQQVEFFATDVGTAPLEKLLIANSGDNFHMGISSFQGILGTNWNRCFCYNRYRLGFNIQWEFNQVSDINKFSSFSHFLSDGLYRQENTSLELMGLTFGGYFDF